MSRVYNFSAGPSMLPEAVLRQAAAEMLDYQGSGQSVMEMSHRSKTYQGIIDSCSSLLREVLNVPENYEILFLQGGASSQFAMLPLQGIAQGAQPITSYNYGARRPRKVLRAAVSMALMALVYTLTIWAVILLAPHFLISIFSSDPTLQADTIPAMKLYFSTFGFMLLQYVGQTVFKSLNKRRHAVFFSLLRKVIIVVPLTYLLPYAFGMGTDGVFAAEPVSNVIGGSLCFIVMLITVLPELKRMDREDAKTAK